MLPRPQKEPGYCQPWYIDGLLHNCNNPIANALELPQSCAKPSIYPEIVWVLIQYKDVVLPV